MKSYQVLFLKIFTLLGFVFGNVSMSEAALSPTLASSVEKIYNADFAEASRGVNSYIASHPNDPAGHLLHGMISEWDQIINNKRRALNPQILADYQKANDLALAAYEADKDNLDKKVMLGNTYMYIAKKLVDDGKKMRGGFALKKAKELMLQAIEKDPNNEDAYMALGVFNYFSANVPSGFKFLAGLLGFNGNEAKGIDYLKRAAGSINLTQGDAGFLLVYIYDDKEKDYASAQQFNDIMKGRYPNNPAFQFNTGELTFRQKKYKASRDDFEQFWAFCDSKPKGFCSNKYLYLSHYFTTWSYVEEGNFAKAKVHLAKAIPLNDGQYKDRNVDLDLWAGMIAAREGDKEKAQEYFKKVELKKSDSATAWALAQKDLLALKNGSLVVAKMPPPEEEADGKLNEKSEAKAEPGVNAEEVFNPTKPSTSQPVSGSPKKPEDVF